MRPRCSTLTGGFDFSGCGDCTSCPPIEQTEMSNSEPSPIVLQGIPCICGLYIDSNGRVIQSLRRSIRVGTRRSLPIRKRPSLEPLCNGRCQLHGAAEV